MKTRIVKVLGFFVLNIVFFTILLGFARQADGPGQHRVSQPVVPSSEQMPSLQQPGNVSGGSFRAAKQNLVVVTAAAEIAIN